MKKAGIITLSLPCRRSSASAKKKNSSTGFSVSNEHSGRRGKNKRINQTANPLFLFGVPKGI